MIKTLKLEIHAANPQLPLCPSHVYEGSAATFVIIGVPRAHGKQAVTGVTVNIVNPDGLTSAYPATRDGSAWVATVPADALGGSGSVGNGVIVSASGTDETSADVEAWILGAGDLVVMELDGTVKPGERLNRVNWFETAPESPKIGNMAPMSGVVSIYTADGWRALGGPTTVSWSDITSKPTAFPPTAHTHAQSDVTGLADALAEKASTGALNAAVVNLERQLAEKVGEGFVVSSYSGSTTYHIGDIVRYYHVSQRWTKFLVARVDNAGDPYFSLSDWVQADTASEAATVAARLLAPSANDRAAWNAKVGSFAVVGGVTPTVSGGVADLSALFSTAPSVPKPTPTGKLSNAELESSIMAVAGSGGDVFHVDEGGVYVMAKIDEE